MKIKTYESLRRGFPTIVSPRVHDVFRGVPGRDYLVCDTPESYAKAFRELKEKNFRARLGGNARRFMEKNFRREDILSILRSL
jgi:hypothetical protein